MRFVVANVLATVVIFAAGVPRPLALRRRSFRPVRASRSRRFADSRRSRPARMWLSDNRLPAQSSRLRRVRSS